MAKNINVWYERDMSRWEGECNGHKAHGDSEEEVRRQLLEDTCADGYEVAYNLNLDEMKRRNAEEKKRRRIQEKLEEAEQEKR